MRSVHHAWPERPHPWEALLCNRYEASVQTGLCMIGWNETGLMGCYAVRPYSVRRIGIHPIEGTDNTWWYTNLEYALFYSAAAPACRTKSLATASSARSFVTKMFLALATGPRREAGAVKFKSICNKHRLGSQDVHGHLIWGVPVVSSLNIANPINPVLIICNMKWTRNASRSSL